MSLRFFITPNVLRQSRQVVCVASGWRPLVPVTPLHRFKHTTTSTQHSDSFSREFSAYSYKKMEVCMETADWQPQADVPRGTLSDPIIVDSVNEERLVGCVCDPDSSAVTWIKLKQGTTSSCRSCGNCFTLQRSSP